MSPNDPNKKLLIDVLSDGTGETALAVLKAALVQYNYDQVKIKRHENIKTKEQVTQILQKNASKNDSYLCVYTFVLPEIKKAITDLSKELNIISIDVLGDVIKSLDNFLDGYKKEAGILRGVNRQYFKRIEAMEYSLKHDDGQIPEHLDLADIILVGVSRTSKTPLSIFLSYKGWKVANVPLVSNIKPPENLFKVDQKKIIALTINPEYLFKIRKNRLEKFGVDPTVDYASKEQIYEEIEETEKLFQKQKWPVFNVTERALEETAAEIIRTISQRKKIPVKIF